MPSVNDKKQYQHQNGHHSSGSDPRKQQSVIERGIRMMTFGNGGDNLNETDEHCSLTPVTDLLKSRRTHEKQQLGQLNDRFAAYIARVRFLEGQNKKLLADLAELKQNWSADTKLVRDRYEPELQEARASIELITRDKASSEIGLKRGEYSTHEIRRMHDEVLHDHQVNRTKIACLEQLLGDNERECALLRQQMSDVQANIERYKTEARRLRDELKRLLEELDAETLRRINVANEKQTLEEQIPFQKAVFEQELAEMRLLATAAHSHVDPAQFYRNE
jgi:chromosome segregation ATPase